MSKKKKLKESNLQKRNIKINTFVLFALVIILPLCYSEKLLDPNLSIRLFILSLIVLVLFVILLFNKKRTSFSYLKLAFFLLLLIIISWTIFVSSISVNPSEGLYEITKLILFFLLIIFLVSIQRNNKSFIETLCIIVIFSSIISFFIGTYQFFKYVPFVDGGYVISQVSDVKGLMANKNQYATSIFLMLPFIIYGIIIFDNIWKKVSVFSLIISITMIIVVQTRASWVALTFSTLIAIYSIINIQKKNGIHIKLFSRKKLLKTSIILVAIISISSIFLVKSGMYSNIKKEVISIFDVKRNSARIQIWDATLKMSRENPIFGVGSGCWKIDIVNHYRLNTKLSYQNWRRAHNDYLQILAEKGVLGLILHILMFGIVIYYAIKIMKSEAELKTKIFVVLLESAIIGYMLISLFSFPYERINHQVYLALIFSIIINEYISYYKKTDDNSAIKKINKCFPYLVIIIAGTIFYSYTLLESEIYVKKIKLLKVKGDYKGIIETFDKAFSKFTTLDALSTPIHHYKGEANIHLNNKKQAVDDFINAKKYFPGHISTLNNLGILSYDINKKDFALECINEALVIYPKNKDALYNKTLIYYKNKDYIKAYEAYLSCYNKEDREKKYETIEYRLKSILDGVQ